MKNIEIKYRVNTLEPLRQRLEDHTVAAFEYRHQQEDIYFKVENGRLKLRLEDEKVPHLIAYHRHDSPVPRPSNYTLTHVENVDETIQELTERHGELIRVRKQRELYLYKNVRVHLDFVEELGAFLELESVVDERHDEEIAQRHFEEAFEIVADLLGSVQSAGYMNLLLDKKS